jgi:hypothetical protein
METSGIDGSCAAGRTLIDTAVQYSGESAVASWFLHEAKTVGHFGVTAQIRWEFGAEKLRDGLRKSRDDARVKKAQSPPVTHRGE